MAGYLSKLEGDSVGPILGGCAELIRFLDDLVDLLIRLIRRLTIRNGYHLPCEAAIRIC